MKRHLIWSARFVAAAGLPTCLTDIGDGENAVPAVWDLRTSLHIDDVDWPEDSDSDSFQVDPAPGEVTILLPDGATI